MKIGILLKLTFSHLVKGKFVRAIIEEQQLAVLCLRYLTFECFTPELPDDQVQAFLRRGYYAFLDYAILHWVDHLEAFFSSSESNTTPELHTLCSATEDFFAVYAGELEREDIDQELEDKISVPLGLNCKDDILLLISDARKSRKSKEQINALGELGDVISKIRKALEDMSNLPTLEATSTKELQLYYGGNWFKCPRHSCFYFHEGFSSEARRNQHVDRHERPFCCTESGCPRIQIGFSSERELKKHISLNHPDLSSFVWKFPKIKKDSTKNICDICSKEYTRASSLRIHLRTHNNERQFGCTFCSKRFLRKHDRARHVGQVHGGQSQPRAEGSSTLLNVPIA